MENDRMIEWSSNEESDTKLCEKRNFFSIFILSWPCFIMNSSKAENGHGCCHIFHFISTDAFLEIAMFSL